MKTRTSFVFYVEWAEALEGLAAEKRCQVYEAVISYANTRCVPELDSDVKLAFNFIKKDIDRNAEKYDATCEKRRQAMLNRWQKAKKEDNTIANRLYNTIEDKQDYTIATENENENENGNENGNENENESTSVDKKNKQKKGCEFELAKEFELFRKAYPGSKRSLEVELANLKRKFPQNWREIIPQLRPALERLLEYHRGIAEARSRGARVFAPNFANLSTWLNNCRWQDEYPDINRQINLTDYGTNTNIRHYPQQSADERKAEFREYILNKIAGNLPPEPDISDCY